ncbi:helix-turn-helix transcriptional regulator [Methylophaga sp. 42_25_T18]|nr:helix-turn-helix transcriptional regulator [Methylophaga sp. 42_25_T18]OUR86990.1 helix-turn-helix transcriptional regulator [Methylophaga sp. 42_8_T64]
MTVATLFIATPEQEESKRIVDGLSSSYLSSEFGDLDSLVTALDRQPDLILCHQYLVEEQQAEKISEFKTKSPNSKLLILGPSRPMGIQIAALKNGARGYFDDSLPIEKLNEALKLILHGEVWVERHVISGLIDELVDVPTINEEQQHALDTLSPKEIEVAEQVSYGATNKMIAKTMNITERTVKSHLTSIFQKMGLPDRLTLAIFFRDLR